jgi:hypothetical protein
MKGQFGPSIREEKQTQRKILLCCLQTHFLEISTKNVGHMIRISWSATAFSAEIKMIYESSL